MKPPLLLSRGQAVVPPQAAAVAAANETPPHSLSAESCCAANFTIARDGLVFNGGLYDVHGIQWYCGWSPWRPAWAATAANQPPTKYAAYGVPGELGDEHQLGHGGAAARRSYQDSIPGLLSRPGV